MLEKLQTIQQRFDEVSDLIIQPDIIADQKRYIQLNKEYKDLSNMVERMNEYKTLLSNIEEAESLIKEESDEEMIAMAKMELEEAKSKQPELEDEIKFLLIPKDPEDTKNVVVEIRAGTGGDEASIFAGDLYRMYTKYCQSKNWKVSFVDSSDGTAGGFKEVIFEVSGEDVYGTLKYESGVHRVQRVPQTETQGRVHTSAATVMVLPEAEEFDVEIDMNEVRIDYFCSSGPGGQSVNTTYSAVRLTHEPTGIVAQCQDQKSQHKNKDKALKVLRSRLYELELSKKLASDSEKRNSCLNVLNIILDS
ncbi:MAG: peptide chain release factor 1, partial [Flavobacteriaceae bacterium]